MYRDIYLLQSSIPGLRPAWLNLDPSDRMASVPDDAYCQVRIFEGYAINPETGGPDENEPRIIAFVTNMYAREIPAAYREAARVYILQAADRYCDLPLIAPEQESAVFFLDEQIDGIFFFP